jgi:hypothetical protein
MYLCSDKKYRNLKEIMEELSPFSDYGKIFEYRNYQYVIQFFDNNYLNGYIVYNDTMNVDDITYTPHGEITGGYRNDILDITGIGFDCAHYNDITIYDIQNNHIRKNATVKMPLFVEDECKKMIDSIYNIE